MSRGLHESLLYREKGQSRLCYHNNSALSIGNSHYCCWSMKRVNLSSSYTFTTHSVIGLWPFAQPRQCYSVMPTGTVTFVQPNSQSPNVFTTTSSILASLSTTWGVHVNGYIFSDITATSSSSTAVVFVTTSSEPNTAYVPSTQNGAMAGSFSSYSTGSSTVSTTSGLDVSDQIALGIGIPNAIAAIIAAYFTYKQLKRKNSRHLQQRRCRP